MPQIKPPANLLLSSEEEHQMVPCTAYRGSPGGPSTQPFRVAVHPHAQLMMDFHSHLSATEVIGVLGGAWDADSRMLRCPFSTSPASIWLIIAPSPCGSLQMFSSQTVPCLVKRTRSMMHPAGSDLWGARGCVRLGGGAARRVLRAVPVWEIAIEDGSINVEMDPEDQFKAVQSLEQMNMQ